MKFLSIVTCFILPFSSWGFADELPERYHTYQEVVDTLTVLGAIYDEVMYVDTLGYSQRDTIPMLRVKLSDNPRIDEDEPAVFFDANVHAYEVLGVEVAVNFLSDFLDRYSRNDPDVIRYLSEMEIFVVPMINPEGHIVVEGGDGEWRKNKSDNDSNGFFDYHDGVDNNRNYDFGWDIDNGLEVTTPESLMFKGYYPFSESENRAMRDFGWRYRPLIAIDYHSPDYGRPEVAYYPWYWYPNQGGHGFGPDETMMRELCSDYAGLIIDDAGDSTYEARRALVNKGDFKTYYYGNFGTVSFSVEISDTTIQDPEIVDDIVARHLPSQYFLLERALGPGIDGIIRDSVTLEPLEAEVQVLQHINQDINPRLSRPDFGRYRRILDPGTYTLRFLKDDYITRTIYNVVVGNSEPTTTDVLLQPLHPRPAAPELIYPEPDDTLSGGLFTFDWSESELADNYLLEVSNDSLFSSYVILDSSLTFTQYELASPLEYDRYFWRVKGGNSNGWGPYTETSAFVIGLPVVSIDMIPDNPPVVVPAGGSFTFTGILTNNTGQLQITDVWIMLQLPGGAFYGPLQQFNNVPLTANHTITVPGVTQDIPWFAPLGTYDYVANCGDYPLIIVDQTSFPFIIIEPLSAAGDTWDTHDWFSAVDDVPSEYNLVGNYPNPFNAATSITFNIPTAGNVSLEIFNILGQRVETPVNGYLPAGRHVVTWDASGYSSGVYFYQLQAGDYTESKRMLLIK